MTGQPSEGEQLLVDRLRSILDRFGKRYAEFRPGASDYAQYVDGTPIQDDEEVLTEQVLAEILEQLLGFPKDEYVPQRGKGGLKPDFTPRDLIAHPFVLDAKSSTEPLERHRSQIARYVDQRRLDYGVLFNLKEISVYPRGRRRPEREFSFSLLPLWRLARGEAMPSLEVERLSRFVERFRYREMSLEDKVRRIAAAPAWNVQAAAGDALEIDVEYLVDQLRGLSRGLAHDASEQRDRLFERLALNPGQEGSILEELRAISLDIAPGTNVEDLPAAVPGFADAEGVASRAWRQYLMRVAQLALTRILLYRSWEDAGYVAERLYDGGFGQLYERLDRNVREVVGDAFRAGGERYRWLFGADNNYDWYRPGEAMLVDVLYVLVPVPLGKLDADVLGGLYEAYVDEIDRDRLGQFYTPRSVVRFMLDRAGFTEEDQIFRVAGDVRHPRTVLDFATGSGGFVVEAARRIVRTVEADNSRGLSEGLAAIVRGIHGAEISPFPYYLSEVNLLLQVSRLLGALRRADADPPPFTLRLVHTDTLSLRRGPDESLSGLDASARSDHAVLAERQRYGLAPLDAEKQVAYEDMRADDAFDLVVGNPPYVAEAGNKVLFDGLRALPGWKGLYKGKSDYLYYFLRLATEKVRPGGRLCVVVPAGWMNAGNAGWLRELLASSLRLDELFLFGSYRLFAPDVDHTTARRGAAPPTVESAILLASKQPAPKSHKLTVVALEDEPVAAKALAVGGGAALDRERLLAEMARRAAGRAGRKGGIHVNRVLQRDLVADRPWPVKHAAKDVASRVVAHLDRKLGAADTSIERLERRWHVFQGIQTGADSYTNRVRKRLPDDIVAQLADAGLRRGDPIMELPPGRERETPWDSVPDLLARSPESRAILYGAVDADDYASLVWIGRADRVPESVKDALLPWRPVLATRPAIARDPGRHWWETAWPRDKDELRRPKVIALYRTARGRFAVDEDGAWQPSIKTTICTAREEGLSVAYLCGLLNSELLDLWYAVRGKTPWHVRRNYEPKPMAGIPYRHVVPIARDQRPAALLTFTAALARQPADADAAEAALGNSADERFGAAGLEALVRAIAANRAALLPHRRVAPELNSTVKDPWKTGPARLDLDLLLQDQPATALISARLDPALSINGQPDGVLGRPELDGTTLRFRHGRRTTLTVDGPPSRLELLRLRTEGQTKMLRKDLEGISLPKDHEAFATLSRERQAEIDMLLGLGRRLVEMAERLVCRLYGVSPELENDVVAHAEARVAR